MSSPVKLATPYPTIEDAAEMYGISPSRLGRVKKLVEGLVQHNGSASSPTNASRKARKSSRAKKSPHHVHVEERTGKSK
jgi:hypothetical protein